MILVQKDDEEIPIKWTKREKALIVVVVFLIGVVGITGWYVLSETHKGKLRFLFFCWN